jgi:hypothetical protein
MSALERLAAGVLLGVLLVVGAWFGVRHYGAQQQQAGWDAAVAAGEEARAAAALASLAIESGLRARLLEQDTAAFTQERKHAESLEDAQRRVRTGIDRLRCPTGPVPAAAPAGDRPAAARSATDGEGPAIVPEDAAEILGDGADVARLVRRYERVVERFDACRAVNAK